MSHTAHIPSHRKPRRSSSKLALRAGVAGGVLSTIAVAASPAQAEPVTETIEMPTLTNVDLSGALSSAVAASAEATQQDALVQDLRAQEDAAAGKAAKDAKTAKDQAERKAEAERKAQEAEEKARAEARERASRTAERTTLSASSNSGDSDGGSSSSDSGSSRSTATGSAAAIVDFARAQIGDAYVMGATGPNAWDCSGLVQAAYRQAGIDLPRVSGAQSSMGTSVSLSDLQPGDILYWGSRSGSYHVAIYVGGGNFVGAQNPGTGVVERSLDYDSPSGAVRIL
ncbi:MULTISPECIES: C40 family peptidase [Streptomyces]|uniref:Glycoside hydrolase n=2 Tax=Streptomyces TaxID=1883 RepID=A0A100Y0R8_9ACTN|nr:MULTISPECIES: C40 family peptidase [Streptomyces]KUH35579.1 glycoside hydrolase [Streptomyces kanasensis]UUS32434.1 C40 family peptidase [Streptomyces changanensis]